MARSRLSGTSPPAALTPGERFELEAWLTSRPEHQWALKRLDALCEECLDHFRGTGELGYDWVATCRNWIRRAPQFNPSLKVGGALKTWAPEIVPEGDRMPLRGNLSQILKAVPK